MYSIDPLKESDQRMRFFAVVLVLGFLTLAAGLWHVQVISFKKYERYREVQSYRTVREPAIRGKIFDRNGLVLADNRPNYEVVLYLEELRPLFQRTFSEARERHGSLSRSRRVELERLSRFSVVSNIWAQVTTLVNRPMTLTRRDFERHWGNKRYVPLSIVQKLDRIQVARFVEKGSHIPGVDLELQSLRYYPHESLAAHVIGHVGKSDPRTAADAEQFSYHQPDYRGLKGIEQIYDDYLRGEAGGKSILINNLMYRQEEHVWYSAVPGANIYLTIDLRVQKVAEEALARMGDETMGAVVVMDVRNGDVVAMASAPTYDPNEFIRGFTQARWDELGNDHLRRPLLNRAANGVYTPGSIFKIVVGLAFLEDARVDPEAIYQSLGFYQMPRRHIKDTAGPGGFDFARALAKSSNPYFIHHGLQTGIESLIDWGERFFLGKATGLLPFQELGGSYPSMKDVRKGWHDGETANLSIGQGAVAVTPLQMALMTSAVANGGKVFRPRIASAVKPQGRLSKQGAKVFPEGVVRGRLRASQESIRTIHEAMLLEVAGVEGTGKAARVRGYAIGGKTGTAETNKRIDGRKIKDTWFASFGPMENPRYAVVVLVVDGISGGKSCAPIARQVYECLRDLPRSAELSQRPPSRFRMVRNP